MRYAQELERALMMRPLLADAERFSTTVTSLKVKAEKVRWSGFTVAEKKRLKDARVALDIIQDSSTTPEQRNAQYRRIAKLLDGLIVLTLRSASRLPSGCPCWRSRAPLFRRRQRLADPVANQQRNQE